MARFGASVPLERHSRRRRGVVALIGRSDEVRPMFMISGNANGLRTCEVRHAVQHAHADGNLGCLRVGASRPQAVTRERFEAIHRVLRERAPMVAAVLLPLRQPSRAIESTASLRHVAPDVFAGQ